MLTQPGNSVLQVVRKGRSAFKTALKKAASRISDFTIWALFQQLSCHERHGLEGDDGPAHKRSEMTLRYSHVSADYKRAAVAKPPSFGKIVSESQQISQQPKTATVVKLDK